MFSCWVIPEMLYALLVDWISMHVMWSAVNLNSWWATRCTACRLIVNVCLVIGSDLVQLLGNLCVHIKVPLIKRCLLYYTDIIYWDMREWLTVLYCYLFTTCTLYCRVSVYSCQHIVLYHSSSYIFFKYLQLTTTIFCICVIRFLFSGTVDV